MNYRLFKIERKLKWFGRLYQVLDDQDQLIYEAKSNSFSKNVTLKDYQGNRILELIKKSAWFKWKYNIFRSGSLISTMVTKNKKFKPVYLFDDAGRHIRVVSNKFFRELTFFENEIEIAKGSRMSQFKGNHYGLALSDQYDYELFISIIVIIDIIRKTKKIRKAG